MQMFEVGGCVRDEILGQRSKDIDFSVVLTGNEDGWHTMGGHDPYKVMLDELIAMGIKVFRDNDGSPIGAEFLTVRGQAPKDFPLHPGRALDFVLARKESDYTDGRRPDNVEVGTLMDDLARRDFTMNAIAKDTDGTLIDPFNGRKSIEDSIIRAVGNPFERLSEDSLRAIRAMRFAVTKSMDIEGDLRAAMEDDVIVDNVASDRISDERIQVELSKMFRFDTRISLSILASFPKLTDAMFSGSVSLDATMKQKGRGK